MTGNAVALEGMGAKAGDFTLKTLTRMGPSLRLCGLELLSSVRYAVTERSSRCERDGFTNGECHQIRKQLIEQGFV